MSTAAPTFEVEPVAELLAQEAYRPVSLGALLRGHPRVLVAGTLLLIRRPD